MSDRESSQVGYRLRGIEPPDLARYPDPVKLMFKGWVVDFELTAKDRDLAAGLGADGTPLRPLLPKSIKHRKSQVGPTHKQAPPLEPSYARSRVRSLLRGRAHSNSAEFFWAFDSVTGKSFADILRYQRDEYGRDVFGLSPDGTDWVQAQALKKWNAWKQSAHIGTPAVSPIGKPVEKRVIKQEIERRPVRFVGRTDLENMTGGAELDEERTRASIKAGLHTGFRILNAEGEKWTPGSGLGEPITATAYTPTQKRTVEQTLAVPFNT